jgi:hypothetical protein
VGNFWHMTILRGIAQPADYLLTHMLLAYWRKLLFTATCFAGGVTFAERMLLARQSRPDKLQRPSPMSLTYGGAIISA